MISGLDESLFEVMFLPAEHHLWTSGHKPYPDPEVMLNSLFFCFGVFQMVRKDPEHCSHTRINRVLGSWFCNDCGAEFVPKNPKHMTKWQT
jgi:hypothetical protein